ncbi:MAG: flagellar basal body L-ring protein FlgH [Rhodospirillales bacterium]|nr:flagellar basal body L-ring protein FlgH [Rhodospirillales bacterium]
MMGCSTSLRQAAVVALAVATLSACQMASRLTEVGDYPELTPITNPQAMPGYQPINVPMPTPQLAEDNPNSLWRPGARAFFKDIRAKEIGDQLTVRMRLNDGATWNNKTKRDRSDSMGMSADSIFGFEGKLAKVFPDGVDNTSLVSLESEGKTDGKGDINRKEKLELTFAAMVTQILPNGSLVIRGRQEVRVNYELRDLVLTGIIRPQDIDSDNTISHERVAEMRMAYGGRGTLSDLQQPRWGSQLLDIILPF